MADNAPRKSLLDWFKSTLPTRETIAANRWLRPFAKHLLRSDLWKFNRRSVPRAVAIGLLIGPIIPVAHTVPAVLLAIPTRANIVIAGATTWLISNPLTYYPLYKVAGDIGRALMNSDIERAKAALNLAWQTGWGATFLSILNEGKTYVLGTVVMAVVIASLGYLAASFFWRWKIGRDWRKRTKGRSK